VVAEEETGLGVASAKVTLVGTELVARTDSGGTFEFRNAPLGRYLVRVQAEGFPAVVEEVEITPGVVPLPVFVQNVVAALDGIVTFGRSRNPGRTGVAKSAADLVAQKIPRLKPLVDRSTQQRNVPKTFSLRGRNSFSSASEPMVVLDGIRMSGGIGYAMDLLRRIPASDVKSVQILPSASASFLYGAPDGAIIVDTKSGQVTR
jgi:TonB-dependent starch-binding outer membrane protein SusC